MSERVSVEGKLYDAFMAGCGVHLTATEVVDLLNLDDAILARMGDAAAGYVGGGAVLLGLSVPETWEALVDSYKKSATPEAPQ